MFLSEIFNTKSIALYSSEAASNKIPFLGEAFFPNKKKMGLDLQWLKTHKGLGVALKPSNPDAVPTIRPRGQAQMTKEEMPFFRESMIVRESDLLELSRIDGADSPFLQPIIDSLYNDAGQLMEGADISAEIMRMSLLAPENGVMDITVGIADDVKYSYQYDKDNSWKQHNYLELSGGDTWDKSTAKPLNDIRKAIQYLSSIGVQATTILGNSTTFDYLLDNDQVKSALLTISGQPINFMDESTVDEVLRRKMRLEKISYDKMYTDYDGNQKKFYPDGYVTILGNGILGNTWRGTTPEELTTIGNFMDIPAAPVDISVLSNGVAVAIKSEYQPAFTATTTVSQIVLPSFEGMDTIFVIKVK